MLLIKASNQTLSTTTKTSIMHVLQTIQFFKARIKSMKTETSIDVLPPKKQALCKYCTHVSNY